MLFDVIVLDLTHAHGGDSRSHRKQCIYGQDMMQTTKAGVCFQFQSWKSTFDRKYCTCVRSYAGVLFFIVKPCGVNWESGSGF